MLQPALEPGLSAEPASWNVHHWPFPLSSLGDSEEAEHTSPGRQAPPSSPQLQGRLGTSHAPTGLEVPTLSLRHALFATLGLRPPWQTPLGLENPWLQLLLASASCLNSDSVGVGLLPGTLDTHTLMAVTAASPGGT